MAGTKYRKERRCFLGKRGTFAQAKAAALAINNERASMLMQDVYALGADGSLAWFQPHMAAAFCAGMMAGAVVGQPITFKYINVSGIRHVKKQGITPSALELFDPRTSSEQAIQNGLLVLLNPSKGGIKIVLQNSTYNKDDNFVYNRPSVLYVGDYVAMSLREQLENTFVGEATTFTAGDVKTKIEAILNGYIKELIIVRYRGIVVTIVSNTIYIDMIITPVEGIDFVLNRIELERNQQSA
jgi:phage tail sheath gpL-like